MLIVIINYWLLYYGEYYEWPLIEYKRYKAKLIVEVVRKYAQQLQT